MMTELQLFEFIALKMFWAFICGLIIGIERRINDPNANATLKTQILVSVGSMMFTIMPAIFGLPQETARVVGQIVTGIGFLGAGAIIHRDENRVSGLTTAAWIWFCSGMGMLVGAGHGVMAVFITFTLTIIISFTKQIEKRFFKRVERHNYNGDK